MAETKAQKVARIPAGSIDQQPLPTFPKLPQSFYTRHPEDKSELDAYTAAIEEYFKKSASRSV